MNINTYAESIINSLSNGNFNAAIKGYSKLIEQCASCTRKEKECQGICLGKKAFCYHNRGYIYLRMGGGRDNYDKAIADFREALRIFQNNTCYNPEYLVQKRCIGETYLSLSLTFSNKSEIEDDDESTNNVRRAHESTINGIYTLLEKDPIKIASDDEIEEKINGTLRCEHFNDVNGFAKYLTAKDERDFIDILGRLYYEIGKNYNENDSVDKLELHRNCLIYAKKCFDILEDNPRNFKEYGSRTLANLVIISCQIWSKTKTNEAQEQLNDYMSELIQLENDSDRQRKIKIIDPHPGDNQDGHSIFFDDLVNFKELLYISRTERCYNNSWLYNAFLSYLFYFKTHGGKYVYDAEWYSFKYFICFLSDEVNELIEEMATNFKNITVYKFYSLNSESFNSLLENIKNDRIYFSTPDYYDDKVNELKAYRKFAKKIPNHTELKLFFDMLKPYKEHGTYGRCSYSFFPSIKKEENNKATHRNNVNFYQMWTNYAASYKGICIEYEIEEIFNASWSFEIEKYNQDDYDVYNKIREEFCNSLSNLILINRISYKSQINFENDIKTKGEKFNVPGYLKTLFFSKPEDWQAENEIRLVSFFDHQNDTVQPLCNKKEFEDNRKKGKSCILGKTKKVIFGYKFEHKDPDYLYYLYKSDIPSINKTIASIFSQIDNIKQKYTPGFLTDEITASKIDSEIQKITEPYDLSNKYYKIKNAVMELFKRYRDDGAKINITDLLIEMNEEDVDDLHKFHYNYNREK